MKAPQGWAIGRVLKAGRLCHDPKGRPFVEAFIQMDEPRLYSRGPYHQKVAIRTFADNELAIVSLLKVGARVRAEGDIDWTSHKDEANERFYGQVRITGSITLLEEAAP